MSIWDYIHKYAPAKDKNDPVKYTNDMVNRFNQAIGSNVITKDTSLGELKEALLEAGLDPEHTITRAHLQTEDPSVLKALDSQSNTPAKKVNEPKKKVEPPKVARPAPKEEAAFDFQNILPTPNFGPPSPLIRKEEAKVQPTIPPRTIVKKQPTITPTQEPSITEDISNVASNVASNIYKGVGNTIDDVSNTVSNTTSTIVKGMNNSYEGLKAVIKQ